VTAYDLEPPFDPEIDRPPVLADTPPNSRGAEQALLGTLLVNPELAPHAATLLDRDDIYRPEHQVIWDSIHAVTATGALSEPALVLDHLTRTKELNKVGGAPYLFELVQAGRFGQLDEYARIVRDTSRLRSAQEATSKVRSAIQSARPENVTDAIEQAVTVMDQELVRFGASTNQRIRRHVETIDELLHGEDDDTYDWVIPGLLERQERVIITAEEGAGKSTLLRQIAVQAASGIHPFTLETIAPITVLHIDVENTRRQSRRRYRPMRLQAGHQLEGDRLRIELRTAGLDLTTDTDREWLLDTCRYVQPDLLLIGPIYKLANGDPTEEKSAKPVAMALDLVRDQIDCAIVLEAHAAKATGVGKGRKRPHEPYGWSGWMRWPEVGVWLDRDGTLSHWRGAREERNWPHNLQRGGTWPWAAVLSDEDHRWETIRRARLDHGEYMSIRELEKRTGLTKAKIERVISPLMPYHAQWKSINGTPSQRSIEEEL
jgi:hypothetical protein